MQNEKKLDFFNNFSPNTRTFLVGLDLIATRQLRVQNFFFLHSQALSIKSNNCSNTSFISSRIPGNPYIHTFLLWISMFRQPDVPNIYIRRLVGCLNTKHWQRDQDLCKSEKRIIIKMPTVQLRWQETASFSTPTLGLTITRTFPTTKTDWLHHLNVHFMLKESFSELHDNLCVCLHAVCCRRRAKAAVIRPAGSLLTGKWG